MLSVESQQTLSLVIVLTRVDFSLTGSYTCLVSSPHQEADLRTSNLVVFRSPSQAAILQRRENLSCQVTQVYPLPQLRIMIGDVPVRQDGSHVGRSHTGPSYDLTVWKIINVSLRGEERLDRLGCELTIPGTDYSLTFTSLTSISNEVSAEQSPSDLPVGGVVAGGLAGVAMLVLATLSILACQAARLSESEKSSSC